MTNPDQETLLRNRRTATKFSVVAVGMLIVVIFLTVRFVPRAMEETWIPVSIMTGYVFLALVGGLIWKSVKK
ncbi:MAG: hypothetical protein JNK10_10220 [Cyclobacteriaceae bacterium]|nr:hypothetical protein [Cyclobacteriaceae bacterium]